MAPHGGRLRRGSGHVQPTDVAVAPNGDVFVSDGHVNSRIVKFSKDGKFLTTYFPLIA
jgi:hypothetical protein